jgi:cytochrome c556
MKTKSLLLTVCLGMALCGSLMAQSNNKNSNRRAPRQIDAVVDTAVLNKMSLDQKVYDQVIALQQSKLTEMQEQAKQDRADRSEEARKARQEARKTFTAGYRAELRTLLGDELYIQYLERQLDQRATPGRMMPNNNGNRQQAPRSGGFDEGFGGGGDF